MKQATKKTPKHPTAKQIYDQISGLAAIKPTVRRKSLFGDDHWEAIDAQIYVLVHRPSEAEVDARFGLDSSLDDEDQDMSQNTYDSAMDALSWLEGTLKTDLVSAWKELVKTK